MLLLFSKQHRRKQTPVSSCEEVATLSQKGPKFLSYLPLSALSLKNAVYF